MWLFVWASLFQATLDRPDHPLSSGYSPRLALLIAGPLALGIRIFANPPPLEDEEENGEEPSESDHPLDSGERFEGGQSGPT